MRKVQNVDDDKYWTINRKKYRIAPKKCKPIQTCKIYNYAKGEPGCGNNEDGELSLLPHLALKVRGPQFSPLVA